MLACFQLWFFLSCWCVVRQVYVEALGRGDLEHITGSLYPGIPRDLRGRMVEFNERLHHDATVTRSFAHAGGPWEFNLRDILRWGQLCCPPQGAARPSDSQNILGSN